MAVVALRTDRRGQYLADQPSDSPASRGLETTIELGNAKKFADQTAINNWVTSMGGTTSMWTAMTVP